jgi:hypothetical protein
MNFNFYMSPHTYRSFYAIVLSQDAHKNGCLCGMILQNVERSIHIDEYTPESTYAGPPSQAFGNSYETPNDTTLAPTSVDATGSEPRCSPDSSTTIATAAAQVPTVVLLTV